MNSLNLKQAIDGFFEDIKGLDVFLTHLRELSGHYSLVNKYLSDLSKGGAQVINSAASSIHNSYLELSSVVSKVGHRRFYKELELFQSAIKKLKENWGGQNNSIYERILYDLDEFASCYDDYVAKRSPPVAQVLLNIARQLNFQINTFTQLLDATRSALGVQDLPDSADSEISLYLPEYFSLKDFAERLMALQSMYSELCALFGISEVDYPLRIGKVESGSLWALLFGNTQIISMITTFIKEGAHFVYRNCTTEGKISALPRKMEAIDALLNLTQRLEAAGLNTADMKPNIEKAAFALSRDLATLIDGQPSITVNDEKLSLQDEFTKALLERREVRLLERNPEQKPDEAPDAKPDTQPE